MLADCPGSRDRPKFLLFLVVVFSRSPFSLLRVHMRGGGVVIIIFQKEVEGPLVRAAVVELVACAV
jgi:hypothetical protein